MKKKKLITALSAGLLIAGGFTLASCTNKGATTTQTEEETTSDLYYYASDSEDYLLSIIGNKFSLTGFGGTYTGTLSKNGTTAALTFKNNAADGEITYLSDGSISLTFNGGTYTFLKRTSYEVTYVVDGVTYESSSVINGKKATKPADPEKEGAVFIGWYTDREYTTQFLFDYNSITEDTTLYARFVDTTSALEFEVTFVDGTTMTTSKTEAGMVINFPETKEDFVGWYYSSNGDTTKLSTKYEGETLKENTTLYAVYKSENPIISVKDGNISWTSVGTNLTYELKITSPSGTVTSRSVNATSFGEYKFTEAGCYTITVSANGKSTTVYYTNKQLAKVSNFNVVAGSVLMFNSVENATKYLITIDCGNKEHNHKDIDLGNTTYFDFSNCQMQEGGIKFTVKAVANGYVTSISEEYSYELNLDAVTGLKVDTKTGYATWNKVENALSYKVEVTVDDKTYVTTTTDTNFSLKEYTGTIKIAVTPVTEGYNSPEATNTTYEKTILATPVSVKLEGKKLTWDTVDNAKSYNVYINGKEYKGITINSFTVTNDMLDDSVTDYEFSVVAVAEDSKNNSKESDAVYASTSKLDGTLTYKNKCVSWNGVLNADHYLVQVDSDTKVSTTETIADIEFKTAGYHIIKVSSVSATGVESDPIMIEVYVNKVTYNVNGGKSIDEEYYVLGDTVTLPTTTKPGYDLEGWYNIANGAEAFGKKYQDGFTMGATSLTLYANWTSKKFTVTLDTNDTEASGGTVSETSATVSYNQAFTLPIAVSKNEEYVFEGWYTEPNGSGKKYTDAYGNSVANWNGLSDTKLYANWAPIVSYEAIKDKNGNVTSYRAVKGQAVSLVTEVTIPATHNGLTVTEVGNFAACGNLVKLNIPDTITYVDKTSFDTAYKLQEINMYETGTLPSNYEYVYKTYEGVLYYNNQANEVAGWELSVCPKLKSGILNIMEGTVSIPLKSVSSKSKITVVNIPYTVTNIESQAFYYSTGIKEINFLAAPEKEEEKKLSIAEKAFQSCTSLLAFTIPARLTSFDISILDSCKYIENMYVEDGSELYSSNSGILCSKDGTTAIYCPKGKSGEFTIPTGVTKVGDEAFKSCTYLEKIIIPNYVVEIGVSAFQGCTNVTEVSFNSDKDDMPLTIKECAFYGLTKLTEITIPENVIKIEAHAFGGASTLTKVSIYATSENIDIAGEVTAANTSTSGLNASYVTEVYIGSGVHVFDVAGAFGGYNDVLSTVEVDPTNPYYKVQNEVLFDADVTQLIFFPKTRGGSYEIPSTVKKISYAAFRKRTNLTQVIIPASVEEIGNYAFYGDTSLTSIEFKDGEGAKTLTIGDSSFRSCTAITSLSIPNRTTSIGNYAFSSMSKITTFVIPEGVTSIGAKAFYSCYNLTSLSIPSTVSVMYAYNENNEAVEFGTDDSLEFDIVSSCSDLVDLVIAEGNEKFSTTNSVLYIKTDGVTTDLVTSAPGKGGEIVVPKTVKKIWTKAFYNNSLITKITFEEGKSAVTYDKDGNETEGTLEIGDKAFLSCSKLEEVELPNITELTKQMFMYDYALKKFNVSNKVTKIAQEVFYYCSSLSELTFEEGNTDTALVIDDVTSYIFSAFYGTKVKSIAFPERTTKIGNYAFDKNTELTSVTLPSTITTIGKYAFSNMTKLENLTIADGANIKSIADYAFYSSTLSSINLTEGLETIGSYAFAYTKLASVTIPSTVKSLGTYAFYKCTKLASVEFTDTDEKQSILPTISTYAFSNCTSLESITIPSGVTAIQDYAFSNDKLLSNITFNSKHLATIGVGAFQSTGFTEFTLPTYYDDNDVQSVFPKDDSIGINLFAGCKNLKKITISASVTNIDKLFSGLELDEIVIDPNNKNFKIDEETKCIITDLDGKSIKYVFGQLDSDTFTIPSKIETIASYAFDSQKSVKTIYVPATVTTIEQYAFSNCTNLETIEFDSDSAITELGDYAFYKDTSLKNIKLPENLTKLSKYMFAYCESLEAYSIPSTITEIGDYAFYNCTSFTNVVVPETVTKFGTYVFAYCSNIKTATINAKLTELPASTFRLCSSLTSVVLPSAITSIGSSAFYSCTSLKNLTIPSNVTTIGTFAFAYMGNGTLDIPSKVKTIGADAFYKSTYETVNLPASLTSLGNYAFEYSDIKYINFDEDCKLTSIGNYTFQYMTNLETLSLPDSITFIGTYAFRYSKKLKSVKLPAKLKVLGTYGFYYCEGLEEITLPKTLTSLGGTSATAKFTYTSNSYMFYYCKSLKKVTFEDDCKLAAIPAYTFYHCESLEEVVNMPSSVTAIGNYAFGYSGLKEFDASNVTTYGTSSPFGYSSNLTKVTLNDTLKKIPNYMFQHCSSLKDVNIPSTVTEIGNSAFLETAIEEVDLTGILSFGTYAFSKCYNLKKVTLDDNLTSISKNAFEYCSFETINLPSSLTTIGTNAFQENSCLTTITIPASVTSIPEYCFKNCSMISSINFLGENVTSYEAYAFQGTKNLKTLAFPDSLVSLGNFVFQDSGLTGTVTLPARFTSVGSNPFAGSTKLESVVVEDGNANYKSGKYGELYSSNNELIFFPEAKLQEMYKGDDNDGTLDMNELYDLKGNKLDGITILPNAFERCDYILKIVLPNDMTVITTKSLSYITNLQEIVFPDGIKEIDSYAFQASGLGRTEKDEIAGDGDGNPTMKDLVIPSTVETLQEYALSGCCSKKITLQDNITEIPKGCFYDSEVVEEIVMSDKVESIGISAFYKTYGLKTLSIPENATLGNYAFEYTGVPTLSFSKKNLSLTPTYLCAYATGLKNVIIKEGVEDIPSDLCYQAESVETVTLPSTLKTIGTYAFSYTSVKEVTIPEGVETIPNYLFNYCSSLETVHLPSTLTTIGTYAFRMSSLKTIVIPNNVTTIGDYAFYGCENLVSVTMPTKLETIGADAFANTTALKTLTVYADSLSTIYGLAFSGWTEEQTINFTCSSESASSWYTTWKSGCNANVVFNYKE